MPVLAPVLAQVWEPVLEQVLAPVLAQVLEPVLEQVLAPVLAQVWEPDTHCRPTCTRCLDKLRR